MCRSTLLLNIDSHFVFLEQIRVSPSLSSKSLHLHIAPKNVLIWKDSKIHSKSVKSIVYHSHATIPQLFQLKDLEVAKVHQMIALDVLDHALYSWTKIIFACTSPKGDYMALRRHYKEYFLPNIPNGLNTSVHSKRQNVLFKVFIFPSIWRMRNLAIFYQVLGMQSHWRKCLSKWYERYNLYVIGKYHIRWYETQFLHVVSWYLSFPQVQHSYMLSSSFYKHEIFNAHINHFWNGRRRPATNLLIS